MSKKIAILGSTGSIGRSTLEVIRHLPEEFEVVALAAKSNIELLYQQALEFQPKWIGVFDSHRAALLRKRLPGTEIVSGVKGLEEIAALQDVDFVVLAMTGNLGIFPAISAIRHKKQIGIANKEILVSAGEWITQLANKMGVELIPIDSEHSAIHQCLKGEDKASVRRLILTASGGIFRDKTEEELNRVTVEEALVHPNWTMGPKITVDCSTMMNKGLEMIEARWLFGIEPSRIEAVVHPQSRVHSFVEFIDGSLLAQLADPDMVLPIQYALSYPVRRVGLIPPYDFQQNQTLTFYPPDLKKFPCLQLAMDAMKAGQSYPCFLNAANEVLVERFLKKEILWKEIGNKLEKLISFHRPENMLTLDAVLGIDNLARDLAACS